MIRENRGNVFVKYNGWSPARVRPLFLKLRHGAVLFRAKQREYPTEKRVIMSHIDGGLVKRTERFEWFGRNLSTQCWLPTLKRINTWNQMANTAYRRCVFRWTRSTLIRRCRLLLTVRWVRLRQKRTTRRIHDTRRGHIIDEDYARRLYLRNKLSKLCRNVLCLTKTNSISLAGSDEPTLLDKLTRSSEIYQKRNLSTPILKY